MTQPAPSSKPPQLVPAYLTWTDASGAPQQFRCFSKSRDYDFGADITRYPVETKSDVTDNMRVRPRELTVHFFESNSPVDENNWASPVLGLQVISIPGPKPGAPFGPIEFQAYDAQAGIKGLAAGGILQALLGVDDIIKTPALLNAAASIGVGIATESDVGEIAGDVVGGTTIIEQAAFLAAEAVLGVPGDPVPMAVDPPDPPVPDAPQVINQMSSMFVDGQDYIALTVALLEKLVDDAQVVSLVTPHYQVDSLVIEKVHIHEDADTGIAAEIEVGLAEVRFVSTTTVPAPAPTLPRASAKVNKGEQGTANAPAQTESIAHSGLAAAASLIKGAFGR